MEDVEETSVNYVSVVKDLMAKKEGIENEIRALQEVLKSQKDVGMKESLVDGNGFPRDDIDVHTVRISRNKIICLQNDLKAVMKEIEEGLHKVHAAARENKNNVSEDKMDITPDVKLTPFLRVNLVSPESPAEKAGIKLNDVILKFGSITSENFKGLSSIGSLVQHSKGNPLQLIIERDGRIENLVLTPNSWSGRGLLGCNVIQTT